MPVAPVAALARGRDRIDFFLELYTRYTVSKVIVSVDLNLVDHTLLKCALGAGGSYWRSAAIVLDQLSKLFFFNC